MPRSVNENVESIANMSALQLGLSAAQVSAQSSVLKKVEQTNNLLSAQLEVLQSTDTHVANIEQLQQKANQYAATIVKQNQHLSQQITEQIEQHEKTNDLLTGLIRLTSDGFKALTEEERINNRYNWDRWLDSPNGQVFENWLPSAQEYLSKYFSNVKQMQKAREEDFSRELQSKLNENPDTLDSEILEFEPSEIPTFPKFVKIRPRKQKIVNPMGWLGIIAGSLVSGLIVLFILLIFRSLGAPILSLFGLNGKLIWNTASYAIAFIVAFGAGILLYDSSGFIGVTAAEDRRVMKANRAARVRYEQSRRQYDKKVAKIKEINLSLSRRKEMAISTRRQSEKSIDAVLPQANAWATQQVTETVSKVLYILNNVRSNPLVVRSGLPELHEFAFTDIDSFPEFAHSMKSSMKNLLIR